MRLTPTLPLFDVSNHLVDSGYTSLAIIKLASGVVHGRSYFRSLGIEPGSQVDNAIDQATPLIKLFTVAEACVIQSRTTEHLKHTASLPLEDQSVVLHAANRILKIWREWAKT